MRYVKTSVIVLILYIFQETLLSEFKPFGVVPNLVAVAVFCFSLSESEWFLAGIFGALCGILLDAASGAVFGLNALLCMGFAILCCVLSVKFFKGKFMVCLLFAFCMSFLYETFFYVFGFALWNNTDVIVCFLYKIVPVTLLNTFAAAILYIPVKKINEADI